MSSCDSNFYTTRVAQSVQVAALSTNDPSVVAEYLCSDCGPCYRDVECTDSSSQRHHQEELPTWKGRLLFQNDETILDTNLL